jgi:hypothetical protein
VSTINRKLADIISTTGEVKTTAVPDIGLSVYSTLDSLPTSALTSGDQAFVSENNRIYVSNGSGWYNIALLNATPTLSINPSGAVTLAVDGVTPTVITLTGTDSDNADASLTYSVESDGSFADIATLSQDSSVFTITPLAEGSATPGSSTLTFKVSDGISFGSGTTQFSLTFGPDWSATPTESKIVASDAQASDQFGYSVSMSADGTYAIVSAVGEDGGAGNPITGAGAAYIFSRSGSSWTEQAILRASDAQTSDAFGWNVSISSDGSYAIVGAQTEDAGGNNAGAAYVYVRSGSTWTQQAKLTASDAQANDRFGISVSMSSDGTYAIIAAYGEDGGAGDPIADAGAVYVFTRSGSTWTQQAKITASDAQAYDAFGISVSMSSDGTYAIVGSYNEAGGAGDPLSGAGSAYIFTRSGSSWTQQAILRASDAQVNDFFGVKVSMSSDGSYVIVGAHQEDGGAGDPLSAAGAAYIFTRSGSTWTEQAILRASDAQVNDYFGGNSVSINSDGTYAIVSTASEDGGAGDPITDAGAAYLFKRTGSSWTQVRKLTASDAQANDNFGQSASISGDGSYAIVCARFEDGGAGDPISDTGAAYIYKAG